MEEESDENEDRSSKPDDTASDDDKQSNSAQSSRANMTISLGGLQSSMDYSKTHSIYNASKAHQYISGQTNLFGYNSAPPTANAHCPTCGKAISDPLLRYNAVEADSNPMASSPQVVPMGPLTTGAGGMSAVDELSLLKDQVQDVARVCNAVARGDLSQKITVPVQGVVMVQLKDVINKMVCLPFSLLTSDGGSIFYRLISLVSLRRRLPVYHKKLALKGKCIVLFRHYNCILAYPFTLNLLLGLV